MECICKMCIKEFQTKGFLKKVFKERKNIYISSLREQSTINYWSLDLS